MASQATPALSTGEAEFVATVKAGTTALGIRSLARDFGDELTIEIGTDSGAAKGILSRVGLGRIRHLDTGLLWIQHFVDKKIFKIVKLNGKMNSADLGTKDLAEADMRRCLRDLGVVELTGSHPLALSCA